MVDLRCLVLLLLLYLFKFTVHWNLYIHSVNQLHLLFYFYSLLRESILLLILLLPISGFVISGLCIGNYSHRNVIKEKRILVFYHYATLRLLLIKFIYCFISSHSYAWFFYFRFCHSRFAYWKRVLQECKLKIFYHYATLRSL